MANWSKISRNAKTHGDFAGRTPAEQDVFFEFFGGPDPKEGTTIGAVLSKAHAATQNWRSAYRSGWPVVKMARAKPTTSH